MQVGHIHALLCRKLGIWRNDNLPYVGRISNAELVINTLGEMGYQIGVELGPYYGFTEKLCKANPQLQLMAVGTWASDAEFESIQQKLSAYSIAWLRQPTLAAVEEIADRSLDLLFVNPTGRFDQIMLDIIRWVPKVRPGGMVVGSHFCHSHRSGMIPAVEAYVRSHNICPWYITKLDVEPLWFWVN